MRFIGIFLVAALMLGFSGRYVPQPYAFPELVGFPPMPSAADNPVTVEGVDLGRHLFYDPILSRDSSMSCASCHSQVAAFADPGKRLSVGISGVSQRRNTPPLFNLAWNRAFFWDGRAPSLEAQALHPVRDSHELGLPWRKAEARLVRSAFYRTKFRAAFGDEQVDSVRVARALAQFERTLISHNSRFDRAIRHELTLTEDEYAGYNLVNDQTRGNCLQCHITDRHLLGTTGGFSNNGLDPAYEPSDYLDPGRGAVTRNRRDTGLFRIPSLRNVALTAPYMHDGRFATLEEVVAFYANGVHASVNRDPKMGPSDRLRGNLTEEEQDQILAFLHTLTDSTFLSNPAFGNPFR